MSAHRYGLSRGELELLSLDLEHETGYDSIPTIERVYDHGIHAFECCWPDCSVRRLDAAAMWEHVHFGKHGKSFDMTLADLVRLRRTTIGMHQ